MRELKLRNALKIIPDNYAFYYSNGDDFDSVIMVDKSNSSMCRMYWYHDNKEEILLDWLNVSEDFRGNGLGSKLQELREQIGRMIGASRSVLWVDKDQWMKQWYERRGYVYHSDYKAEKNAIWMKKEL